MSGEKAFSYQLLNLKELWEEVDIIKTVADDYLLNSNQVWILNFSLAVYVSGEGIISNSEHLLQG